MDAIICQDKCNHAFCMELRKYTVEEKELLEEKIMIREESLNQNEVECLENRLERMNWMKLIEMAFCPEVYRMFLDNMLEDKRYSEGDMEVISFFTRDICKLYPENATEIQAMHLAFVEATEKMKSRAYCVIL